MERYVVEYVVAILIGFTIAILRSFIKKKTDKTNRVNKEKQLNNQFIKDKSWRRLDDWNEDDYKRDTLSSQEITSLLKRNVKEIIDPYLLSKGFTKHKNRLCYRMIKNEIVYEIMIYPVSKGQKGIRGMSAYFYPLCFIGEGDESCSYYRKNKSDYELPFYFDCALEESLTQSVLDMKNILEKEFIPFLNAMINH